MRKIGETENGGEEEGESGGLSLLPTQYFWDLPSGVLVLGTPKGRAKGRGHLVEMVGTSSLSARPRMSVATATP